MDPNNTVNTVSVTRSLTAKPVPNSAGDDTVIAVAATKVESVKTAPDNLLDDLTRFNREDLVKGFVFSLILDKPRCKQRGRW